MAQSSLLVHGGEVPWRGIALGSAVLAAILGLYMLNGGSRLPALATVGVGGAVVFYKAWVWTRIDRQWLIVPLTVLSIFVNSFFLAGAPRAAIHYGTVILFCAPCVPIVWRTGIFRRGGFQLFSIYFGWALLTVTYSLAPEFSVLRLLDATLVFCALGAIVFELKDV